MSFGVLDGLLLSVDALAGMCQVAEGQCGWMLCSGIQ